MNRGVLCRESVESALIHHIMDPAELRRLTSSFRYQRQRVLLKSTLYLIKVVGGESDGALQRVTPAKLDGVAPAGLARSSFPLTKFGGGNSCPR